MRRTTSVVLSCSFLAIAMAIAGCTSDMKSDGATAPKTTRPKATTTLAPTTTTAPAKGSAASLQLRPVVGSQLCSSVKPDAPDETTSSTTVKTTGKTKGSTTTTTSTAPPPITGAPDLVPDHDGVTCYGLGPAGGTGEDLEHAKAVPGPEGEWIVTTRVRDASRSKLNNLFDACYRNEPYCAASDSASGHGQLAFVLDGEVVSAPTVQALGLALSDIQISGGLTKTQAEHLAALIGS